MPAHELIRHLSSSSVVKDVAAHLGNQKDLDYWLSHCDKDNFKAFVSSRNYSKLK
jgi:hypothetical protein